MRVHILFFILAIAAMFFPGCDSFSLSEQFSVSSRTDDQYPLAISPANTRIVLYGNVALNPSGGKQPYSYEIIAEDIAHDSGTYGSVADGQYTTGGSTGRVRVRLRDAENRTAETVLTVIPPVPVDFNAVAVPPNSIGLEWSYNDSDIISGFLIERKSGTDADFSYLVECGNIMRKFTNNPVSPNVMHTYRIFAVSGEYRSNPSPERTLYPNL